MATSLPILGRKTMKEMNEKETNDMLKGFSNDNFRCKENLKIIVMEICNVTGKGLGVLLLTILPKFINLSKLDYLITKS
ncbi:MAG: hypothetical protein ACI8RD_005502 [Bacillariaceae sp.]|jgi:hypothetical protein